MNADEAKAKINAVAEKAKPKVDEISTKAKAAMSEIRANFKADEGTTGVKKVQSMFVNLWKSGNVGKAALIACSVIVLLLFVSLFTGSDDAGGSSTGSVAASGGEATGAAGGEISVPSDTLVVKKLYMHQPGDDALAACKQIVGSSDDLAVLDFRKGIPWDPAEKEAAMKVYESWVATAKVKVAAQQQFFAYCDKIREMDAKGISQEEQEKAGFKQLTQEEFNEKFAKKIHPEKADMKEVEKWLERNKHVRPSDLKISAQNLIKIAIKENGKREDAWKSLCNVWIDDEGKVKEVFFTEDGMARIFNAGDLSGEEFAHLLVKNYAEIPSLEPEVKTDYPGRGAIKTYTWIHKDPRGFQVKLFERAYFGNNGQKYTPRMVDNDAEVLIALSLANLRPTKYFVVFAIKPESERKFD